jgi:lipid kinase YegS
MAWEAAAGIEAVVAGGGDGTINEVVSGVVDGSGRPSTAVGVLPLGTANDFARGCGIPVDDPLAALDLVANHDPKPIDLDHISGRCFVNLATGGFGTRITVETPPDVKRVLGGVSYLVTGLTRFNDIKADQGRVVGPDFSWEGSFYALGVGNGRQAGGGVKLCPEALLNDALFDVVILPDIPQQKRSALFSALVKEGLPAIEREVVQCRVPWLEVSVPSGLYINLDGEPIHGTEFRFEIRERWIPFHLPEQAPLASPLNDRMKQ